MNEAGSLFELFYRKTTPLHVVPIEMTGGQKALLKSHFWKKGKGFTKKYTQVCILDTGFLINPVSLLFHTVPQTSPEPCTPRSDGDGYGYKS